MELKVGPGRSAAIRVLLSKRAHLVLYTFFISPIRDVSEAFASPNSMLVLGS
jgi:hypothetical protein